MTALSVVGSDADNYECPWCGCNDRERHLLLFIKALQLESRFESTRIAHFAPEKSIRTFIQTQLPDTYIAIDLTAERPVDMQTNLESIAIASETMDVVIANHILEHIYDLNAGLRELNRILKRGGLAILQTPYSERLHETFCDPGIISDRARLHAYGQEDHVRLFGRDIISVICASGFKSRVASHQDLLADIDPSIWGVNAREPLMLFEKC